MTASIRRTQNTSRAVIAILFMVVIVCILEPRFVAFDVVRPPVHLLVHVVTSVWDWTLGLASTLL